MARRPTRKEVQKKKNYARAAVKKYLAEAKQIASDNLKHAHQLVHKARRTAMKARIRIPVSLQRSFCKHCYHFLLPPHNARIRVQHGKTIIYCSDCKKYTRIPLNPRKSDNVNKK